MSIDASGPTVRSICARLPQVTLRRSARRWRGSRPYFRMVAATRVASILCPRTLACSPVRAASNVGTVRSGAPVPRARATISPIEAVGRARWGGASVRDTSRSLVGVSNSAPDPIPSPVKSPSPTPPAPRREGGHAGEELSARTRLTDMWWVCASSGSPNRCAVAVRARVNRSAIRVGASRSASELNPNRRAQRLRCVGREPSVVGRRGAEVARPFDLSAIDQTRLPRSRLTILTPRLRPSCRQHSRSRIAGRPTFRATQPA